jgi:hypothetical protein
MHLRMGEMYVSGRDGETARALLAAADRAGVDQHTVRTVEDGFIIPETVGDEYEKGLATEYVGREAVF